MQLAHVVRLGAAAALACCAAAAWYLRSQGHTLSKARRWVTRNAPAWTTQIATAGSAAAAQLEPGETAWPAQGFAGPARCRPLSTVTELLTWMPLPPPAAAAAADQQPAGSSNGSSFPDPCACTTPLHLPAPPQPPAAAAAAPATDDVQETDTQQQDPNQQQQQQPGSSKVSSRSQLLVCHDMRGGYLDYEALLSGSTDASQYRIWHWDCVDVFVYFSHHLVTIPPKGWIHAAHKHGVKVLGTFITEFGQGRLRCDRLFSSAEGARRVADQLVAIAQHYGFEGWLVNIENPLSAAQVSFMQHFVGYLRAHMRDTCPHSMVVWYDAVTTAGQLKWQNGLTPLNAPFFDLSDALFVNYTWTPPQLPATTAAAGGRGSSVYMGVDVFGRGSYGGGGFGMKVALEAAAAAGLSAALFAPGWVHENLDNARFHELQDKWWGQVQRSWGLSHPVVTQLPFSSSFNTGAGWARFAAGRPQTHSSIAGTRATAESSRTAAVGGAGSSRAAVGVPGAGSWYDLCETDTLPSVRDAITQQVVSECTDPVGGFLSGCTAWEGGSCLVLYRKQQQQQPADAALSTADVAVRSSSNSSTRPASGRTVFALLQLFSARVPLGDSPATIKLSCVFAVPPAAGSSSGSSGTGGGGSSGSTGAGGGSDASSGLSLWGVTEDPARPGARVLYLPASSRSGPGFTLKGGESGVEFGLVPGGTKAAGQGAAVLGNVQLLPVDVPSTSAEVVPAKGEASSGSSGPSWVTPLPAAVAGWRWQLQGWKLSAAAGETLVGVCVAVPIKEGAEAAGDQLDVVALLGRIDVSVL